MIRIKHLFRLIVLLISFVAVPALPCMAGLPGEAAPRQLYFIENKNQWDVNILYRADLVGGELYLEKNQFTYNLINPEDARRLHPHDGEELSVVRYHAFKMHFSNSNPETMVIAKEKLTSYHNYYIGNDPSHWAGSVSLYREVNYKNIYAGVDVNVYSSNFNLKYDFVVSAGSDASQVHLNYEGTDGLSIDKEGSLVIALSVGNIAEQKPYAYQFIDGKRKEVTCRFVLSKDEVTFSFPNGYNKNYPLVIDPTLIFSSYTGSTADNWGFTATYDQSGNLYSGGMARGTGYPITVGAYQTTFKGAGAGGNGYCNEITISKFNATGTTLVFSTYLGGSDNEQPNSLVVNANDELIVYGATYSNNFPVTGGAFDVTYNGLGDIIISKFNASGTSLLASTYVGGSKLDGLNISDSFTIQYGLKFSYADETRGNVDVDSVGNIVVATCTQSTNFPTTAGVLQTTFGGGLQDGVVFRFNPSLTAMQFCTYLGGSSDDAVYCCALAPNDELYVAGGTQSANFKTTAGTIHTTFQGKTDGFVAHLNATGSSLLHSTFLGTNKYDQAYFVQLDYDGNVYACGQTMGAYPVTAGVYSNPNSGHFIHKMSADLSTTFFSTVFGSGTTPNLALTAFLVDTCENIYVAGWGRCINAGSAPDYYPSSTCFGLPITADAMQKTTDGCDFYFICLSNGAASLLYASYFGGPLSQEHVDGGTSRFDKRGTIYEAICGGCFGNSDLTTTPTAWSRTNNSGLCNLAAVKMNFDLSATVSSLTASPLSGCVPFTAQFINNSVTATNYIWDFGDGSPFDSTYAPSHIYTDTGTFLVTLIAINSKSCNKADTAFATVVVTPPDTVKASFSITQSPFCDSLIISATSKGGGQVLNWDFGDLSTAAGITVTHTYLDTGNYIVTLIASDTVCSVPDTIKQKIHFGKFVRARIDTTVEFSGCKPLTIRFSPDGEGGLYYQWQFGDGASSNAPVADHTYTDTGTFTVTLIVSDSASCNVTDTVTLQVVVYDIPKAGFRIEKKDIYQANENINLFDESKDAVKWNYDFGNGDFSTDTNPVYQYHLPGRYKICQTVETDKGCPDIACRLIDVVQNEAIYIPNSFTPNGDGVNDYFNPFFVGILELNVKIFNRWGELIFEWDSLDGRWDGTTNGKQVQEDVYVYKMTSSGYEHKNVTKVGRVTLVR